MSGFYITLFFLYSFVFRFGRQGLKMCSNGILYVCLSVFFSLKLGNCMLIVFWYFFFYLITVICFVVYGSFFKCEMSSVFLYVFFMCFLSLFFLLSDSHFYLDKALSSFFFILNCYSFVVCLAGCLFFFSFFLLYHERIHLSF